MAKFRKKPVVIEAVQWFRHGDHPEVTSLPADHPVDRHDLRPSDLGWIKTLEGGHVVSPGDWIIIGVQDEVYPCKPDIFEATYEPARRPVAQRQSPGKGDRGSNPRGPAIERCEMDEDDWGEQKFGWVEDDYFKCPTCKGSGRVNPLTAPPGVLCLAAMDCPDCDGTGEI